MTDNLFRLTAADFLVREIERNKWVRADVRGNSVFISNEYGSERYDLDPRDSRALSDIADELYFDFIRKYSFLNSEEK